MKIPEIPKGKFFLKFLLCGAFSALPYVFPSLWFLAWIGLSPAAYMTLKYGADFTKRKAYGNGFAFGLGYFFVMYHWFTCLYPMDFAGLGKGESVLLVAVCWIGLSSLQAFEFGFVTLLYRIVRPDKNRPLFGALTFTALFVIFEWQETLGWRGVPWARLAVTQTKVIAMQQSASLLGSLFVSGLILAVNSLLAAAMLKISENKEQISFWGKIQNKKVAIFTAAATGLFLLNFIFGSVRLAVLNENEGEKVTVGVIQGNISSLEKWGDNALESCTNTYVDLTKQCVEETGAKIVVWPETVIPVSLERHGSVVKRISKTAEDLGITLFVGAFDDEYISETDTYREYNAIYIFYPDGSKGETKYYKRHLVPFGEYTPMEPLISTLLPVLSDMNVLETQLTPGADSAIFTTEYGKTGSLICFDSIYQSLTLDSVRDGAELITLSTNDSWFRDSAAVYQHNAHAALRAIESGRYVARAANTGISTIITPKGETITALDPLVSGYTSADVCFRSDRTVYSYTGDIFVYICIAYVCGMLSFGIAKKKIK